MSACRLKSILQMVAVLILLMNASSADVDCDKNNPLPRPTLSLDPPLSVILPGEEVSLVCHFPLTRCNVKFYRNHEEQLAYVSEVNCSAKVKLEADIKWKGYNAYTCKYRRYFENNRTWACSPHSDPVQLIVTDKLPKPTASIEPVSGVVTVGERVQINCSSSYPSAISHLYKKYGKKPVETRIVSDSERSVILAMKDLEPEDSGAYGCSFEKTIKGKVYESERSYFVEVNVTEVLPKPTASLDPASRVLTVGEQVHINCNTNYPNHISHLYRGPDNEPIDSRNASVSTDKLRKPTASIEPVSGVVTVGERVQINCSSSYPSAISHLYKKHGTKPVETRIVSDSERSVILAMKDLETEDSGAYGCSFEKTIKGKVYESERSYFVEVNVTATLPKANISVHPPSGVVSRGSIIRITCTGSILNSGGCFRLYRDSEQKGSLDMSCPQQSATFTITDTDTDGTWNYNCLYSRKVKGTFYHSPRSAVVQVTVKRSNLFLIHWCLAAVILFGTVILLGIECSHMKRNKDSDGHVTD